MSRRFALLAAVLLCPAAGADDARPVLVEVAPADLPPFAEDDLDRASLRRAIAEELKLAEKPGSPSLGGIAATRSDLVATLRRFDARLFSYFLLPAPPLASLSSCARRQRNCS